MNSKVNTDQELLTDEQRWEAVLNRDASANDRFVCAIKTTGIYCRPSSSSRLPKRENVEALACGANKIAVAIPCHRVVRQSGALSGYRWGVDRKRALLDREGADE